MAGPQKPAYMECYLVSVMLLILDVCIKREKLFGEATLSAGIRKTLKTLNYIVHFVLIAMKYSVSVEWKHLLLFTAPGKSQEEGLIYGRRVDTCSFSIAKV